MAREINLLVSKKKRSFREGQLVRLVKVSSVLLLILYFLVSLGVFSFWLYIREESQKLSQEMTSKREKIAALEKIESLQILLKQRLSSLKTISDEGFLDYKGFLVYLAQFSSAEIAFKDITISQDGNLSLSGEAINALTLADFLDQISGEKGRNLFERIVLSSISRQENGSYSFGLNFYSRDGA